jgi:hypothetical protein
MYTGLVGTIRATKKKYGLEDSQVVELFIDVIGCVEWDLDGVDYDGDDWPEQERVAAKKALEL